MSRISFSTPKLGLSLFYIFVLPLSYVIFIRNAICLYSMWLGILVFFISLFFAANSFYMKKADISIVSPLGFFIIALNIFNFGQAILTCFNPHYKSHSTNFVRYGSDSVRTALLFSFFIVELLTFFCLIFFNNNIKHTSKKVQLSYRINDKSIRKIGTIIFVVIAPIRWVYDVSRITIMQNTGDYNETFNTGFSGLFMQLCDFYIIGVILLLISFRNEKRKARAFAIIIICLFGLSMLSGGRMYSVVSVYIILFVYFTLVEKIPKKNIVILILLGYLGLKFITSISIIRVDGISTDAIRKVFLSGENSVVVSILDEFGSTIFTSIESFNEIPRVIPFQKGMSYIKSLAFIGVNINGSLDRINDEVKFSLMFRRKYSYGGNMITEMYYNFGFYSILLTPVFGAMIAKIFSSFTNALYNNDWIKVAIWLMPLYYCIIWVRDYSCSLIRGSVWGFLLIIFIYKTVQSFGKVKKERFIVNKNSKII